MASAILILHTSCAHTARTNLDDELDDIIRGGLEPPTTHGSDWKPEFAPLTCDFLILPEIPVLQSDDSTVDNLDDEHHRATTDDDAVESVLWKQALTYQPTQYEKRSRHRLNPCGWKNLVVLNDLPPSSGGPTYLLTIASCVVEDVDDVPTNVSDGGVERGGDQLPVHSFPSNFAFTLDEVINLDALTSATEFMGFTEVNVTFDFKVSHRILHERKAMSRPRSAIQSKATSEGSQDMRPVEDLNKSFPLRPSMSRPNPSACLCECSHPTSEFPLLFLKSMLEKEASDFQMMMVIQIGIGVFISILFVWMGIRVFRTHRQVRHVPTNICFGATASAQDDHQRYRDGDEKRRKPIGLEHTYPTDLPLRTERIDHVPALVDQSPSVDVPKKTTPKAKDAKVFTPMRNNCSERAHFMVMYDHLDDCIPEGDGSAYVDLNDYDSRNDATPPPDLVPSDSPASSAEGNDSPSSEWANRWLENRALRQRLRRHKRQAKQHQGRPLFLTPVASTASHPPPTVSVGAGGDETANDNCDESHFEADSNLREVNSTVDEPTSPHLTADLVVRDYWGL